MTTPTREQATAANRAAWDASADYHRTDPQWRALLDGFATPGFSVLDAVETEMFGRLGVDGKAVAQLCCNNGREILSVKNLTAGRCVGFDQSEKFLQQARELATAGSIEAEFVATDVYAIDSAYDGAFDIVLVTIGAIGWMPDLAAFVAVAARLLRPGGHLFVHEQHPITDMFDPHSPTPFEPTEPYFTERPYVSDQPIVYHGQATEAVGESYWYTHTLADIFRACLSNGLAIRDFAEYPDNISSVDWAKYEQRAPRLPLSYALLAKKG
ncbi:MAG: class I SAM-dependent methyltransferase [Alphaproteobacteria bacterium]